MTDLNTAKINLLMHDYRQLRLRLAVLTTEKEEIEVTFKNFSDDIEARLKALEGAENYRQQDQDGLTTLSRRLNVADLSPTSKAILQAYENASFELTWIAAVLRAVVADMAYEDSEGRMFIYAPEVLTIATELETAAHD